MSIGENFFKEIKIGLEMLVCFANNVHAIMLLRARKRELL